MTSLPDSCFSHGTYDRVIDTHETDELDIITTPEGARATVRRGPRQLNIVKPSPYSLVPPLKIFSLVFIGMWLLVCCIATFMPIIAGFYPPAACGIPFWAFGFLVFYFHRRSGSKEVLEISGDRFRIGSIPPNLCHLGKREAKFEDWRQLSKVPELGSTTYQNEKGPEHNCVFIELVEGVGTYQFGLGLTSLELEWLLEKIKEVVGPLDVP